MALERIYVAFAEKVLEMTLLMTKQLDVVRADAYKASGGFQALSDEI